MKRSKWFIVLLSGIMVLAMASAAFAATVQEQRRETRQKVSDTLNKLYERKPSARTALKNAEGYAVFVSSGIKLGILGDSHGRGLAHNNKTGEDIFMRMKEFQVGLGVGAKEYALIFAFIDRAAWNKFTSSKWSYGGQADVAANDGVNGGSFEGAVQAEPGIFVYQMTTKGLAVELSLKGTNYYRDKKLNGESK
jgi:lipid-binding SYLF domain-containing protein